jgi:hypothetical protein
VIDEDITPSTSFVQSGVKSAGLTLRPSQASFKPASRRAAAGAAQHTFKEA